MSARDASPRAGSPADVERQVRRELVELRHERDRIEVWLEDTRGLSDDEEHEMEARLPVVEAKIQRRERLLETLGNLARQHARADALTIQIEALIGAAGGAEQ